MTHCYLFSFRFFPFTYLQLTDANTTLSLAKSEHQRELGALRQQIRNMVDLDNHKELKKQLADAQNKIGQLEAALEKRAAEMTKVIMGK